MPRVREIEEDGGDPILKEAPRSAKHSAIC
jgi:hypothetical protein